MTRILKTGYGLVLNVHSQVDCQRAVVMPCPTLVRMTMEDRKESYAGSLPECVPSCA